MDSPMVRAIAELANCGEDAVLQEIVAVVGEKINRRDVLNQQLLHGLRRQPDGKAGKGQAEDARRVLAGHECIKQPRALRDNLTIKACWTVPLGHLSRLNEHEPAVRTPVSGRNRCRRPGDVNLAFDPQLPQLGTSFTAAGDEVVGGDGLGPDKSHAEIGMDGTVAQARVAPVRTVQARASFGPAVKKVSRSSRP